MHVHAHPDDESSKGAASTAKYVAEGVDVHVATCTGGERGSILNPKMDRPDVLENITEIRRQEMERARDILGIRQDWLGFVDSGWPEGDPKPPLPEGCFALVPLEEAAAPLVTADPRVQAARADDVRRARRLPAPRPHHVPRDLGRGVRGRRRPGALPRRGGAVAAAEALLPPLVQPPPDAGAARRDARARAGVAVGRAAQGVEARARVGRPDHHPGAVRRTTSASATRRCSRTPPRSTRTASGSRSRASSRRRCGRPRTSSSCVSHVDAPTPEDDLFAGITPTPEGLTGGWLGDREVLCRSPVSSSGTASRQRTPARERRPSSLPSVEERLRQEPPDRPPGIEVPMGLVRERVLAQRA